MAAGVADLTMPHCARIDPARLVRGLAEACERLGVTIHERTPVTELGGYAPWISPPKVGIDNKPGDFEYVKIET